MGNGYGQVPGTHHDTGVKPEDTRAPDHGDLDILDIIEEALPAAGRRDLRTILGAEDV
jgi:hypothetical protein